ncbi:methionine ABC transporter ATP-binding protein [Enterovirga rhinocerotis]|uniref:Cell division ATP-binding protein FtsE n=1 Tax=Enterovirga rhinocerotis TaxID=1339210 RepID=A0A4R7C3Y2_9HYPH|nr:methionine ABC transporter ATP-binding protein [Enterovirga rhinocerotis]TDR93108.1 D-methionine transport system ATP-binding protein [Enterovirga rhinocerotis]
MSKPYTAQQFSEAVPVQASDAAIRFEAVSKTFPARGGGAAVPALADLDLAVPAGSILGVIGRSGAGKSTLIRLVNGLEKPTGGRVVVDGTEVSALDEAGLRDVRRRVGMIFQHFNLLSSRTAYDNVALPLEIGGVPQATIQSRVGPLLELVGLADKRNRYPAELSGGQKQRVGIARALATQPKVLLSDEATSALDPETTRSILDLLSSINKELGLTILLITHEMSVIRAVAKEVAVLDGGRVVEHGEVFDVFTRPRHPTTRSFLSSETGHALPPFLRERLRPDASPGSETAIRILFRGRHATDPVVSQLTRDFGLDVNILSGSVDEIAGRPFGTLVVGLKADAPTIERVLSFLTSRDLDAEVIGHVS